MEKGNIKNYPEPNIITENKSISCEPEIFDQDFFSFKGQINMDLEF